MKAWLKRIYYRLRYYKKNVRFASNVLLNTKNSFEGLNTIGENTEIATCVIGLGSYVSDRSVIKQAIIGRFCSIGSNVQTGMGTHPSKVFVSSHPAFYTTEPHAGFTFAKKNIFADHVFTDPENKYVVEIGNDVWIGSNVIIMDGIKIGDGAIVAAGSVVTADVLPYAIVGGVPAKLIRYRFTEIQIEKLSTIKWWNWDIKEIELKSSLFNNIESFISSIETYKTIN